MAVQPTEVLKFLHAVPFRRFRLRLIDGDTCTVEHPELMMVGTTTAEVGLRSPEFEQAVYDRTTTVALQRVANIELVSEPSAG